MAHEDALRDAAQVIYDCIRAKGLDTQVGQSQVRHLADALKVAHHCVSDVPTPAVEVAPEPEPVAAPPKPKATKKKTTKVAKVAKKAAKKVAKKKTTKRKAKR